MKYKDFLVFSFLFSALGLHAATDGYSLNNQLVASNTHLDYLVQNVCVDSSDNVIAGDPAQCANHRNIRIGERSPYVITDKNSLDGNRYQAISSLPVVGTDGALKVQVTKHFQGSYTSAFRYDFAYNKNITGYDLIDPNGAYISAIRTSDGGCFDQIFSRDANHRQDGWIFFTSDLSSGSANHNILIQRVENPLPSNCPAIGQVTDYTVRTVWNAPTTFTFESNTTLSTIMSYHFAHQDLGREENSLEKFFFTREYGFTRWEAWWPLQKCVNTYGSTSKECNVYHSDNYLLNRCDPAQSTTSFGNQTWIRMDCRDSTFPVQLTVGTIQLDETMARTNGVLDIDTTNSFLVGPDVFNAQWYLNNYSDLSAAFGSTNITAATNHWLQYGIYEGRRGSANFSSTVYLGRYSDLSAAFGTNYKLAIQHFTKYGIFEGRYGY